LAAVGHGVAAAEGDSAVHRFEGGDGGSELAGEASATVAAPQAFRVVVASRGPLIDAAVKRVTDGVGPPGRRRVSPSCWPDALLPMTLPRVRAVAVALQI
jgi:hypothetical protein